MSTDSKKHAGARTIGVPVTRKQFLRGAAAAGALAIPGILSRVPFARAQSDPIKLGMICDLTGLWGDFGSPAAHAAQLAVEEINASGGVLDRELAVVVADAQSETDRYVSLTRVMIGQDKPLAMFSSTGSQNREAMRPITRAAGIPYFYTTCYEGGVADNWTFCTGVVPEQGFATLIPYMIEKYGPRVYDLAADYVWGQLSTLWLQKFVEEAGGEVVGTEAIPLNVSDFSSSLTRIQEAKPDWLYSSLTGKEQAAFFSQRAAQSVTIPMSDFVINLGQAGNHRRMQKPILSGLHETFSYVEELPGDANASFVKKFREKYPDEVFVSQPAQNTYFTIHLYAQAIELAGSTDSMEVIKALETGLSFDAPEGTVKVDGPTHHVSHTVHLASVDDEHKLTFLNTWENIPPDFLTSIGVDLTKKEDNKQYSPLDV
jgi:branched-chain amino acid transport system substrate-binding protein